MAPASTTSSSGAAAARRLIGCRRRTEVTPLPSPPDSPPPKKLKPMSEILAKAKYAVVERNDYNDVSCEQCGSGDLDDELLLCDKCDKGFHMKCLRPIVARVPIGSWLCPMCSGQRRVRSGGIFSLFLFYFLFPFSLFLLVMMNVTMWFHGFVLGLSQKKIIDFFRIRNCNCKKDKCSSPLGEFFFPFLILVIVSV